MSTTIIIHNVIEFLYSFKYFVLFIGVIIEGPILMVTSGFLIHTGFFSITPAFIAIMCGDLVGDVFWYGIGYYVAGPILKRHGRFLSITPQLFEKSEDLFHKYHAKILLISKVTIGFGMSLVTLVAAGAMRVSFKKYMILNTSGEFFLVAGLLSIGYFFGQVYISVPHNLKIYFIVSAIIIISVSIYAFMKYMKRKITNL